MDYNLNILRDEQEDLKERNKINTIIFSLLLIIVALVPLITRGKLIDYISPIITNNSVLSTGIKNDIFTYYKFLILLILTSLIVLLFSYSLMATGQKIQKNLLNIFLLVIAIMLSLSLVFSPHTYQALFGFYNRHDGTITYLCYFALLFIAANLTYKANRVHFLLLGLTPVILINVVLGVLGFYNYDMLQHSWVHSLLFPAELPSGQIVEGSKFSTTINHGNYVSGFAGMLIAIYLTYAMLTKNMKLRVVYAILTVLSFVLLFTSLARSGFVAIVFTLPFIIYFFLKAQQKLKAAITVGSILVAVTLIFFPMVHHNEELWDRTLGFFFQSNPFSEQAVTDNNTDFHEAILTLSNKLDLSNRVYAEGDNVEAEQFKLPELPERGVGAGSGRVFIWDRTLDLIKERPFVGYGMDTLPLFFPQNDPEIYANIENYNLIIDKPHNLYIGLAYGAGIITLLAFLGLLGVHFYKHILYFVKNKFKDEKTILLAALFAGWFAYLVQGVFNDTIIGTAPIFFVLFGVGVSLISNIDANEINKNVRS